MARILVEEVAPSDLHLRSGTSISDYVLLTTGRSRWCSLVQKPIAGFWGCFLRQPTCCLGKFAGQSYISVPVHPRGFYRLAGASTSVRKGVSDTFSEVANESCSHWGSVCCGRRELLDLEGDTEPLVPKRTTRGFPFVFCLFFLQDERSFLLSWSVLS